MEKGEQLEIKSFDICAGVNQFSYDIERFGHIKAETRRQVTNEELSYICEGINRASRTSFRLKREGTDLVYFREGQWRPYSSLFEIGLNAAHYMVEIDECKQFMLDRAIEDKKNGYKVRQLEPGQSHSWYSPYPEREALLYGEEFIKECGFNPDRKLGFLYYAVCEPDGSVVLETQTVDSSETGAFDAIDEAKKYDPDIDIEVMTRTYDGYLLKKYGEYFYAGRTEDEDNAWEAVLQQTELIKYHIYTLEQIARQNLPADEKEKMVKEHTYSVWATFATRLEYGEYEVSDSHESIHDKPGLTLGDIFRIRQETNGNFNNFINSGKQLIGCGGSVIVEKSYDDIMQANTNEVFESIFGKERYKFDKKMFCVECQSPPKKGEGKKNCGPCGLCKDCDEAFKKK